MEKDFSEVVESRNRYTFKVSYNGTSANVEVHNEFKDFAEKEADGVYILAIKKLLEAYEADWKYQALQDLISEYNIRLSELEVAHAELETEIRGKKKEEKELKTFG